MVVIVLLAAKWRKYLDLIVIYPIKGVSASSCGLRASLRFNGRLSGMFHLMLCGHVKCTLGQSTNKDRNMDEDSHPWLYLKCNYSSIS